MIVVVGSMAARVARHRAVGKSYSLIPRQRESIGMPWAWEASESTLSDLPSRSSFWKSLVSLKVPWLVAVLLHCRKMKAGFVHI